MMGTVHILVLRLTKERLRHNFVLKQKKRLKQCFIALFLKSLNYGVTSDRDYLLTYARCKCNLIKDNAAGRVYV